MQKKMAAMRASQKQPRADEPVGESAPRAEVHWEGISESEEEEDELEYSHEECISEGEDINPFTIMMARARQGKEAYNAVFKYQRSSIQSKKTIKRKAAEALERQASIMDCRPLDKGFLTTSTASASSLSHTKPVP